HPDLQPGPGDAAARRHPRVSRRVNATTNHILTALEAGEAFAPALARMQAAGIAEADASLDVDGWDAAAKTAALANVLMHARLTPHDIDRVGIDEESGPRARQAVA